MELIQPLMFSVYLMMKIVLAMGDILAIYIVAAGDAVTIGGVVPITN